jgi:hypothetical protein
MRKMLLTALQLQGNMKDNVEYKIVAICSAGGGIAVEGRPISFIAVRICMTVIPNRQNRRLLL